uniref:Uncharacterized protein n=1 Tax=Meloidogyne incognita TaxID=6306 RepID=A0A914NH67_MELIC
MDGWYALENMGEAWKLWKPADVFCMVVGGALHGGSFVYMVAVFSSGPTGRSCSTYGQMGATGTWRECGQLLNMVGHWRTMGPGVVFFKFFFIFLMSSWWLACSWWWFGGRDLVVYLARLPDWWSRLHGGLVEDLQKYGGWLDQQQKHLMDGWTIMDVSATTVDVAAMGADLCFMVQDNLSLHYFVR